MKNKSRIMFLVAATAATPAFAAGPQLVFGTGDESSYVVDISSIRRVEFKSGGVNVVGPEEKFLPYSDFGRISIDHAGTHTPVSVRSVSAATDSFRIMTDRANGTIVLSGHGDKPADIMIFSTAGTAVMSIPGYDGGTIDVSALPAGIYIVKTATGNCAKFIK